MLGCDELRPRAGGVCGNSVVDVGEDCDLAVDPALGARTSCAAAADPTRACRYVCSAAARCPDGWGCASDGICRRATGRFTEARPIELPGDDWVIGDADGDGRADLFGLAPNGVRVAYGDGRGGLAQDVSFFSGREPSGAVSVADVDGDRSSDVILPQLLGLVVLRGRPERRLVAVAYAPWEVAPDAPDGAWLVPLRAPGVGPEQHLGALASGAGYMFMNLFLVPTRGAELMPNGVVIPGPHHSFDDLAPRMPVADLDAPSGEDELALAFRGDALVRIIRPSRNPFSGALYLREVAVVALPAGATIDRGASFADIDGDGAIDLMVSVNDPEGADRVYVARNDGGGTLGSLAKQAWFDALAAPGAAVAGVAEVRRRWPLAAGDLDGDRRADFVTPNGVFVSDAGNQLRLTQRRSTMLPWTEAVIGELDQRGGTPGARPDLALLDGKRGLHVLHGNGDGSFNRYWLDTAGVPALLRSGDLDGDGIGDLAFATRDVGAEHEDELAIVFGSASGAPSAATPVGRVRDVERLELARFRDEQLVLDQVDELLVTTRPDAAGERDAALFVGDAGRALASPFVLSRDPGFDTPLVARAGRFLARPGADPTRDLLCLATGAGALRLWLIPGAAAARFRRAEVVREQWVVLVPDPGDFVVEAAVWLAADVDGDGSDELLGLDRRGSLLTLRATRGADARVSFTASLLSLGVAGRVVAHDLDGDGALELLIAGAVGLSLVRGAIITRLTEGAVASVAVVNVDADAAPELALLEADGVRFVELDGRPTGAGLPGVTGTRVLAADVDADALPDLLVGDGDRVRLFLAVPHVAHGDGA